MAINLVAQIGMIDNMSAPLRQMQRQMNLTQKATNSLGGGIKSIANSAAGFAGAIGITKAFSSAIGTVKDSVSSAFDRIDTMEAFDRTLTTLTGSSEKTKAALDATRDAVTGTAYGLDVAAKGVQDFVTRGMDVQKATSTMAAWGDAVAFYGDGSNEQLASVSDALAKMYSSGKVQMDQMNRLFDAGIDGVGMYAKATGRDVASVQKDLSKGAISAGTFMDVVGKAMMEGTNGVQKIGGAAKEAGASWGASFGNMNAAVARGTTNIIQSIDGMLKSKGLPDMRSMVASFGSNFESVLNSAADKVPVVTDYLASMYDKVKPGIDWIKDTGFPGIKDAIGFALDKAKDMYSFFTNNWSLIAPAVAGVVATIYAFKAGVAVVSTAMKIWEGVTLAMGIAQGLLNGTLAISPLGWVALAIGAVVAAGVLLYKNWDTVKAKGLKLWDGLKSVWSGIETGFSNAWDNVKLAAGSAVNFMIDGINDMINVINKIPGVNVPVVAKVEWSEADTAPVTGAGISNAKPAGSYYHGLNQVPYDGFIARLHKGERILTATENRDYSALTGIAQSKPVSGISYSETRNYTSNVSNTQVANNLSGADSGKQQQQVDLTCNFTINNTGGELDRKQMDRMAAFLLFKIREARSMGAYSSLSN